MLLRQIKYFVTVVDCNSFTEAAEQCYISQSAISQQIHALEGELGVDLIRRENRRFALTPAGEYFYRHSRVLLDETGELCRETVRIGRNKEPRLRIGYLRSYNGLELRQAIADFSQVYPGRKFRPRVSIHIVSGTHEELYDLLRFGGVDLVLNDQRRAFSDVYVNFELLRCDCVVELSSHNKLIGNSGPGGARRLTLPDLRRLSCILISSKGQQSVEQEYYQNTLGFGGSFLFAENLDEGRLMVAGDRGFLPLERAGTLPPPGPSIRRLPLYQNGSPVKRNYCLFWRKENTNRYIEEFAETLRKLIIRQPEAPVPPEAPAPPEAPVPEVY
ncbi:MAG: LysR family transcriptional regulator [Clostridiales bacterium]|jgi:DNA-binding transcriptional LysR family regulator|nr:LysR family transcriptional regulator [Clostridiales bacterium]